MKKSILLIICFLTYFMSYGDTIIEMEEYGGVYRVPCTVNGAKMKLIFDTGASNVCLSLPMAEYLFDNGYLDKSDIQGSGSSSVADGRIVDHIIVNLKDIEIGGQHLYNVEAIVIDGQNSPLLMGQSAIQKLGSLTLEGNKLILHNDEDEGLTQEQIDSMFEEAFKMLQNGSYFSARNLYSKLNEYHLLSDNGLLLLAHCYSQCDDNYNAIKVINSVENVNELIEQGIDYYIRRGMLYYFNNDIEKAIADFEKSNLLNLNEFNKSYTYKIWGNCLKKLENYYQAGEKYSEAMNFKAMELGVTTDFLIRDCTYKLSKKEKSVKDDIAEDILFSMIETTKENGKMSYEDFLDLTILLAYNGNKEAKRYCDFMNINYNYLYHLRH